MLHVGDFASFRRRVNLDGCVANVSNHWIGVLDLAVGGSFDSQRPWVQRPESEFCNTSLSQNKTGGVENELQNTTEATCYCNPDRDQVGDKRVPGDASLLQLALHLLAPVQTE